MLKVDDTKVKHLRSIEIKIYKYTWQSSCLGNVECIQKTKGVMRRASVAFFAAILQGQ